MSPRALAVRFTDEKRYFVSGAMVYLDGPLRQISARSKWPKAVERSIRHLALGRKNALFAGSDEGGDNWAVITTLGPIAHNWFRAR